MPCLQAHNQIGGFGPLSFMKCIVAGNADCLFDDLKRAGDYPIIAVNGASQHVKAFALYSQHPEFFEKKGWARKQRQFHDDFTVNAPLIKSIGGDIKYWDIPLGGGSAWGARKLAVLLGFTDVILCGCPLTPGPYVGNHYLGGLMADQKVVDDLFYFIEKDVKYHAGCTSMSGRTKELFCSP